MRPQLTDRQLDRMVFRIALFVQRGLSKPEAEATADKLADRDYERDDRRLCLECKHLQRDGGCFSAKQGKFKAGRDFKPIKTLLQRCEWFAWSLPA